jgi:hypothetical protein
MSVLLCYFHHVGIVSPVESSSFIFRVLVPSAQEARPHFSDIHELPDIPGHLAQSFATNFSIHLTNTSLQLGKTS